MAEQDRIKWDQKWANREQAPVANAVFETIATHLTGQGRALDLASGPGHNSLHLAKLGYQVDAVDISPVALAKLEHPRITPLVRDLDHWRPESQTYHLIIDTFFLDRTLFPALAEALVPGGLLLLQTWNADSTAMRNPNFKLSKGELPEAFPNLTVLKHDEQDGITTFLGRR